MTTGRRTAAVLGRAAAIAAALAFALPLAAEPPAGPPVDRSLSVGAPMAGSLENGAVLPKRGAGFAVMAKTLARRARYGTGALVRLVEGAAAAVRRKHPGAVLAVADLSRRGGGPIPHHGSHQSGRDVDFAFYMRDAAGKAVVPADFVAFDRNGYSVDPPMAYRFDAARNWALVAALLRSDRAEVQWIFVAEHLKKLLLDRADAADAPADLQAAARRALRQPGAKSHWDHFHVRIRCPGGPGGVCRDARAARADGG